MSYAGFFFFFFTFVTTRKKAKQQINTNYELSFDSEKQIHFEIIGIIRGSNPNNFFKKELTLKLQVSERKKRRNMAGSRESSVSV